MSPTGNPTSMNASLSNPPSSLRWAFNWLKRAAQKIAFAEEAFLDRTDPMFDDLEYLDARLTRLEQIVLGQAGNTKAH
jgi:hypothetical protein